MKVLKSAAALVMAICMLIGTAGASQRSGELDYDVGINMVQLYASRYLDTYGAGLSSKGGGRMCVSFVVCGTRVMDKIGVDEILVEFWDGDEWVPEGTISGEDNSDFYAYNESDHAGTYYFNGTVGMKYKATITAYAELDGGSDTGTASSYSCIC